MKWTQAKRDALSKDQFGDPERKLFPIETQEDVDSAAHLIGKAKDPEKVKARVIAIAKRLKLTIPDAWKGDAKLSVEFAAEDAGRQVIGDYALYPNSLLFVSGDYEDKNFAMTPEELWAAVEQFTSVGGNIEHTEFLQGRACEVRSIRLDTADSTKLRGEVAVPLWLDEQLQDHERRLSCEWDRSTKTLAGIGLVVHPRVPEAALMSAMAKAGRPRHDTHQGQQALQHIHDVVAGYGAVCSAPNAQMASRHESASLQQLHDLTIEHGATCSTTSRPLPFADTDPAATPRKEHKMGFWEQFKATFGLADDWQPPTEVAASKAAADGAPAVTPTKADTPPAKEYTDELARLSAENRRLRQQTLEKDAITFAEQYIAAGKAFPAERAQIVAQYIQAAQDDAQLGACVTFDGQTQSRLGLLKAVFDARPAHKLTQEQLQAGVEHFVLANVPRTPAPGDAPTPERLAALRAMTPLGHGINGQN